MTQKFVAAVFNRRKAPPTYDPSWLNVELARIMKAIPKTVVRTLSANGTLQYDDALLNVNAVGGPISVTLMDPATASGFPVTIKKIDATANVVTIVGVVDGDTNPTLTAQYQTITIQSDGFQWFRPVPGVGTNTNETLTFGTHLTGTSYDGSAPITIATDGTASNVVSTLVVRDASGNFAASNITATGLVATGTTAGSNLVEYSQDLAAAAWVKQNVTLSAPIADPLGGTTGFTLTGTAGDAKIYSAYFQLAVDSQLTYSVYVKKGSSISGQFGITEATAGTQIDWTVIGWTGSSCTSLTARGGGVGGQDYTITDAGSGWYRISVMTTPTVSSATQVRMDMFVQQDGTGSGVDISYAAPQVQAGALTAYAPTTAISTPLSVTGRARITSSLAVGGALSIAGALTGVTTCSASGIITGQAGVYAVGTTALPAFKATLAGVSSAMVSYHTSTAGYGWIWAQDEVTTGDIFLYRRVANADTQVVRFSRAAGSATYGGTQAVTDATDATSSSAASVMLSGGLAVAKQTWAQGLITASSGIFLSSNTLANYSEQNWTSALTSGGGTLPTFSTSSATYTRIGRTVFFNIYMNNVSGGTAGAGSNQLSITLPFTTGAAQLPIMVPAGTVVNNGVEDVVWMHHEPSSSSCLLSKFQVTGVHVDVVPLYCSDLNDANVRELHFSGKILV